MALQKLNSFTYNLKIIVEGKQFAANWEILREKSVVFEAFYKKRKPKHEKSQGDGQAVDSVNIKGIRAEIVEKFLRYVNGGNEEIWEPRQMILREMKDVLIFSVVFQLRALKNLMCTSKCFQHLNVNFDEMGFDLMSKLHQALLRFLFDRTLIYRTKKIVKFLAHEAYKEASLEGLLGILKVVTGHRGTRDEMRLKLLDIAITLFGTDVEVAELTDGGVNPVLSKETGCQEPAKLCGKDTDTNVQELVVPRTTPHLPERQGKITHIYRSKKTPKAMKSLHSTRNSTGIINPGFSNSDGETRNTRQMQCRKNKTRSMKPRKVQPEERPFIQRSGIAKGARIAKISKQVTTNRTQRKHHSSENLGQNAALKTRGGKDRNHSEVIVNKSKPKINAELCQESIVEHKTTRVFRKNVRKLWVEQTTFPVIVFSNDEDNQPEVIQTEVNQTGMKQMERPDVEQPKEDDKMKNLISDNEIQVESQNSDEDHQSPNCQQQRESIFLTGGIQKNDYFARRVVYEFDPINNVYITHKAMTTARYNHGIAQVNEEIYVVGGNSGCFEQLRTVESYCAQSQQWSSQASMREARDEFSLVVCGGCLYAIGGHDGIRDLRTVEKFDIEEGLWSFVSPMTSLRAGACSVAVEDRYIYVVGGFNGQDYLNTVERYDTSTDRWTEIEPMRNKRAYSCLVLSQHNIYVIGGFDGNDTLSACETYDTETNCWSPVPDMNSARMNATVVLFKGNIYIFGGETDNVFLGSVECYDIQNNTWGYIQRLPRPMAGLRACVYKQMVLPSDTSP